MEILRILSLSCCFRLNAGSSYLFYFPSVLRWKHFLSENGLIFIKPTRCYIPEDKHVHTHRCENLKSYKVKKLGTTRKMDFEILLTKKGHVEIEL
jgi:hypothetical protein